ncbi:MAG TPA: hypothetical protein VEA69_02310 [Tepidisphaeraceae bacterium]|nr:hypothetical protein [Tepidisphaeraceae bacterium]
MARSRRRLGWLWITLLCAPVVGLGAWAGYQTLKDEQAPAVVDTPAVLGATPTGVGDARPAGQRVAPRATTEGTVGGGLVGTGGGVATDLAPLPPSSDEAQPGAIPGAQQ